MFKIYQATRDGFTNQGFIRSCDDIGPTLTLYKSHLGKVFGFYTDIKWSNVAGWKTQNHNSFIIFITDDNKVIKCLNKPDKEEIRHVAPTANQIHYFTSNALNNNIDVNP